MGCALAGLWLVSPLLALPSVESFFYFCLVKHWSEIYFPTCTCTGRLVTYFRGPKAWRSDQYRRSWRIDDKRMNMGNGSRAICKDEAV